MSSNSTGVRRNASIFPLLALTLSTIVRTTGAFLPTDTRMRGSTLSLIRRSQTYTTRSRFLGTCSILDPPGRIDTSTRGMTENRPSTSLRAKTGWLHNAEPKTAPVANAAESVARKLLRLETIKKRRNHRMVSPPALHACGDGRRVAVTEHAIAVPVDRSEGVEDGPTVDVFFTVVETIADEGEDDFFARTLGSGSDGGDDSDSLLRAREYVTRADLRDASGAILYLQGGPGFGAPDPVSGLGFSDKSSWASEALSRGFKRIVLMDQRGTGRSTPITKQTLEMRFPDLFLLDEKAKDDDGVRLESGSFRESLRTSIKYLEESDSNATDRFMVALDECTDFMSNFRADNIVRDAEDIKRALLIDGDNDEPRPWGAALGQSFGGFCIMTYLSQVPHPPKICLLTGGIAPMLTPPEDLYESLSHRVKERNLRYYEMYPGDIPLVKKIVKALSETDVTLPSGGTLTPRRFLQLGIGLGGSPTAFASHHSLLSSALLTNQPTETTQFSRSFLKTVDALQPFDDHPLYFLLHESIYANGSRHGATKWAAHRVSSHSAEPPHLDRDDPRPISFSGETVFPWMAEGDYAELSGFGMNALANALAAKEDWGPLYDAKRMRRVLGEGVSRAAAAVYCNDMYVDFDACVTVTERGGPLEKCKVWIGNEHQHSGLRDDGAVIFAKLLGMAKGSERIPS